MTVTLTLAFPDVRSAAAALAKLEDAPPVIAHADRPDVGQPLPPAPPTPTLPDAAAVFGRSTAAQAPAALPMLALTPTPAQGPELDTAGMTWDARIHAETKTKNKDGTWRSKRNLDETLKARVEAELRPASAPAAAPVLSPVGIAAPLAPMPPAVVPAPPAEPLPAVVGPAGPENFAQFIGRSSVMAARDPARYNIVMGQALATAGKTAIGQLAAVTPDVLASVAAVYDALVAQPA